MSKLPRIVSCTAVCLAALVPAARADCPDCVVVAVDLDPSRPGFQTTLAVPPGTTRIEGVAIWIYDPNETAVIRSIGYVGGVNRGISFGHVPDAGNVGIVSALTGATVAPVVAGHNAFLNNGVEVMFAGPEVQYFESGAAGVIPASPSAPVMRVDIELRSAVQGDTFRFHLGDMTATWLDAGDVFAGGAFSTSGVDTLDAGGDAVPDGTDSLFGVDSDVPVPSPPAPFQVDYIDSLAGGGAVITVTAAAVPALSTWALLAMTAAMLSAGAIVIPSRADRDGLWPTDLHHSVEDVAGDNRFSLL